jgi:4-hydroxy-tetrahydrodipicolinate reductase
MTIRVIQVGLGPIGLAVARQMIERSGYEVVAAVDIDPDKVGRNLGELCGLEQPVEVVVETDLAEVTSRGGADVVAHCTGSSLEGVMKQLETILDSGLPIVSTTEELAYPQCAQPALADRLDTLARQASVAMVGTGVNPGFAMDTVPIVMSAACERVDSIAVERIQDAARRRMPFQKKIGAGLEPDAFREKVDLREIRHVGLTESIAMIADAMGWTLDEITDVIEPKVATDPVASEYISVEAGQAAGLVQDGTGYRNGKALISLHMEAYLGSPETYDSIQITGSPNLSVKIDGGIPGDIATAAVAVNTLPRILKAAPGLHTMRDLELPSWWSIDDS